jgi:PPOX class probable F420-dependent enzyme
VDAGIARTQLALARVGYLGTVSADGRPHVVPVCFTLVGDTVYSAVDHKPKSSARLRRLMNIEASGVGCLLVDEYDEDWSRLWWIRIDGPARLVDDAAERDQALDALVQKYPQYVDRRPSGTVLAVQAESWTSWSWE